MTPPADYIMQAAHSILLKEWADDVMSTAEGACHMVDGDLWRELLSEAETVARYLVDNFTKEEGSRH